MKWMSAVVMGFAICGMHYTGMKAARFHTAMDMDMSMSMARDSSMDIFLLFAVTVTIFIILLVSWGAIFFDRHVLEKMAYMDTITGLPNRNEMNRFFDKYTGGETLAVLFIDLDQFKAINDTLGHNVGDLLVQEVGYRLRQFVRPDGRLSGSGATNFCSS